MSMAISTKPPSEWLVTAQPPIIIEKERRETLSEVDEWQSRGDNWQGFCLRFDSALDPDSVRKGLERTLTHIPALGPRVDTPSNSIQYELAMEKDCQGVVFKYVEATTCDNDDTTTILPNDTHKREEWKRFGLDAPKAGYSTPTKKDPLFQARLTIFKHKSISYLAIGISHGLCDGHDLVSFLFEWNYGWSAVTEWDHMVRDSRSDSNRDWNTGPKRTQGRHGTWLQYKEKRAIDNRLTKT
jgi:hypothetical protein